MESQKLVESQGIRLLQQLFLDGKRVFSMADVIKAATLEKIPRKQLKKILSNLAKHGYVFRLHRGLYVSIGLLPKQINTHPFVISTYLIQPSAISHGSALQHHGLTEQISQIVTASTPNKVVTPSMKEKQSRRSKIKHMWKIQEIFYEYITVQKNTFLELKKYG